MRNVTAAIMASTLAFGTFASHAAETVTSDNWLSQPTVSQSHMFDGISLTERQRQQMRDLMQQARHEQPPVNVNEMEAMHNLVTADKFDENAVRTQAEKMAQEQVTCQVEMARVRNQMYRLLTPEQQSVLNRKHQEQMEQLRDKGSVKRSVPLQISSHSMRSNP